MKQEEYNLYPVSTISAEVEESRMQRNLKNGILEAYSE
jgi:hypothetical protein